MSDYIGSYCDVCTYMYLSTRIIFVERVERRKGGVSY